MWYIRNTWVFLVYLDMSLGTLMGLCRQSGFYVMD